MQYMYVQTQMCEFKKCMFIIKVYIHNWSVIKCTTDTGQGQEMYLKSVMKFKDAHSMYTTIILLGFSPSYF